MKSIQSLIQQINKEGDDERKREYDAFKQTDDNIIELNNRIIALEKKNLKYFARVGRATNQSIATATPTMIIFTTTTYPQLGNMHDNTADNDKVFIRRNGVYHLSGGVQWGATAGGTVRQVTLYVNRNGVATALATQREAPIGAAVNAHSVACSWYCYVNDFIQLEVTHDQGGPVNIIANGVQSPFLAVAERMEDLDPSEYGLFDPNANTRT